MMSDNKNKDIHDADQAIEGLTDSWSAMYNSFIARGVPENRAAEFTRTYIAALVCQSKLSNP